MTVSKTFYLHPKFHGVSLAAVGLWLAGHCYSRDHRKQFHLSVEDAEKLARGDSNLITELCDVGLWDREDNGFTYHDHQHYNAQDSPRSTASRMVYDLIPDEHPSVVKQQLAVQVSRLLEEGQHTGVIADAIRRWLTKESAPPTWLPMMVSDVLRANQGPAIHVLVEAALKSGDIGELERLGFQFIPPDPSPKASVKESRAEVVAARKAWLRNLMEEVKQ